MLHVARHATIVMLALAAAAGPAFAAAQLDLYDWMGVAPIVIQGDVVENGRKYVRLKASRIFRGELEQGEELLLNLRKVNRSLDLTVPVLKLPEGGSYLLLLRPAPPGKPGQPRRFDLVRGVNGVREVPAEGAEALLGATEMLVGIQDTKDEAFIWEQMRRLLDETNPILVVTSLEHHLKFARGTPALLPAVRPLLDHPRADVRETTARLIGHILERHPRGDLQEEGVLFGELSGRARRDSVVAVRVAATEALAQLWDERTERLMREISERDPDQLVRYAAERMLYEHRSERPR